MNKKLALILVLLFAVLASLPWLVPHTGLLILVAFVPLLLLDYIATGSKQKHFFWWYYAAFVLWNGITTFWVCNATMGGGIFASLANAAQMALVWAIFRLSKKRFKGVLPYVFLMVMWMAWERQYFHCEISWPWLTLGYAFGRSTSLVQWYEVTGLMGGSLWAWLCNLGIFGLIVSITDGRFRSWRKRKRVALTVGLCAIFFVPVIASEWRYASYKENSCGTLDVIVGQPNISIEEKFETMSQDQQNKKMVSLFEGKTSSLYVLPETISSDVWLNDPQTSPTLMEMSSLLHENGGEMLLGASTYRMFSQAAPPSLLARQFSSGDWYENYNSAILMDSTGVKQVLHKSKLVVGTELLPYPRIFVPIDDKLGGVMGRCVPQKEPTVFTLADSTVIGCAICYESIYGEYCAEYVRKGAKAIAVITNDAWWGDTPGYKQHFSYSRIRAIETRRDIFRSANTGLSALIDQKGDLTSQLQWCETGAIQGKVNLNSKVTPFVRYGDIAGKACTLAFLLLAAWLLVCLLVPQSKRLG